MDHSSNPYSIGKLIDKGENGEVYIAKKNRKTYAAKVIDYSEVDSKYLAREIIILMRLANCKYVVNLYNYYKMTKGGKQKIYLIMDYYPAGNLKKFIFDKGNANQSISSAQMLFIIYQLICGLEEIHSHNVIHRRIAPENVLITTDEKRVNVLSVVYCGFSLPKIILPEETTQTIVMVYGSPESSSPFGKGYNNSTDIWSLGMLMYFVMFGIDIYDDVNCNRDSFEKTGIVNPNETAKLKLPKGLFELMSSCFKISPDERPTANDLMKNEIFNEFRK